MGLFGGDSYLFFVVLGSEALCGIDGKISGIEKIWGWLFEVTLRRGNFRGTWCRRKREAALKLL